MAAKKIEFVDQSEGGGAPQKIKTSGPPPVANELDTKTAPLLPRRNAKTKKVFDVARPGKTAAMPVSKPVIVGHTATIKQDPMVAPVSPDSPKEETGLAVNVHKTRTIKPLSVSVTSEDDTNEAEVQNTTMTNAVHVDGSNVEESEQPAILDVEVQPESDDIDPTEERLAAPVPSSTEPGDIKDDNPSNAQETPAASDAFDVAATDQVDQDNSDLGTSLKEDEVKKAASEEEAKKQAAIQELIDSKKFFIPVHQTVSKNTAWVWIVLWIAVVIAGAVLAVDAGYIDIGVGLPFDLIKNS